MADETDCEIYQEFVGKTSTKKGIEWAVLGLTAEAGEVAGVVEKMIRYDDQGNSIADRDFEDGSAEQLNNTWQSKVFDECGDVLWFLVEILNSIDRTLDDCIMHNMDKLNKRAAANDKAS